MQMRIFFSEFSAKPRSVNTAFNALSGAAVDSARWIN